MHTYGGWAKSTLRQVRWLQEFILLGKKFAKNFVRDVERLLGVGESAVNVFGFPCNRILGF